MAIRDHNGLKAQLVVLAALSPLVCALPARAEPFQTGGAGVFLGYAQGEGGGFEWGIEAFATRHFKQYFRCDSTPRHGFGPLLRLSMVKLSRFELTGALHGGGEFDARSYAIDGEIGASLFLESPKGPRVAPHTGVTLESLIFNIYFRQEWLTPAFSVGGGARVLPTFGSPGFCVDGRSYRGDRGQPRLARHRWATSLARESPEARRWARRATEECASVPAFLQLAQELLLLNAPLELVGRALRAAEEELGHTHAAASLAELFGGAKLKLTPPAFRARRRLPRALALRRLITETWLDGCLNEGLAAAFAGAEAQETRVAEEALISSRLAQEEAGHAALAFDVLRWAMGEAPSLARSLRFPTHAGVASSTASFLNRAAIMDLARENALTAQRRLADLLA